MRRIEAEPADKLAALSLEARRLKISYGELSNQLQYDPQREREIISAYMAEKQSRSKKKKRHCDGCAYNIICQTEKAKRMCSFNQTGRVRRRDEDGNCMEYTTKREKRRRDAPTKMQRLLDGDWYEKNGF